jgi:hypothetical protein
MTAEVSVARWAATPLVATLVATGDLFERFFWHGLQHQNYRYGLRLRPRVDGDLAGDES